MRDSGLLSSVGGLHNAAMTASPRITASHISRLSAEEPDPGMLNDLASLHRRNTTLCLRRVAPELKGPDVYI